MKNKVAGRGWKNAKEEAAAPRGAQRARLHLTQRLHFQRPLRGAGVPYKVPCIPYKVPYVPYKAGGVGAHPHVSREGLGSAKVKKKIKIPASESQ